MSWWRGPLIVVGLALALALAACHPLADPFPNDLPPELIGNDELLPAGRAVCVRLGLDPQVPGRCNGFAVLAMSGRQTDRALWFVKTTTGDPQTANCPGAVDLLRSGPSGTITHLCQPRDPDVTVTPAEVAALEAEAERLNAIPHKTLTEHRRAAEIKSEIACRIGTAKPDACS